MAATTVPKRTRRLGEHQGDSPHALGVKGATKIPQGAIAVNNAGVMANATTALNLIVMGVARDTYDNSLGGDNAIMGEAEAGDFLVNNSASTDLITAADVGKDCYLVDNQTVAKTDGGGTRSRAGKIVKCDAEGLYVRLGLGF